LVEDEMELMSSDASTKSSPPSAEGTSADSASSAFRALVEMFEKMKGHGPYRRYMLERIDGELVFRQTEIDAAIAALPDSGRIASGRRIIKLP
jgi:hypothetical protein